MTEQTTSGHAVGVRESRRAIGVAGSTDNQIMGTMRALVLAEPRRIEDHPLVLKDVAVPEPGENEIRLRIAACGVCRTDLHICEGELKSHKLPVIPGHQIIGFVDKCGAKVKLYQLGERVAVPWLYKTCGVCDYCRRGQENLCDQGLFTGYDVNGGFAEYVVVHEDFAYSVPADYENEEAAPLFCAGVIGYQAFKATGLGDSGKLGIFGFGSSAHILIQLTVNLGIDTFVVSRTKKELALAEKLGAKWTGQIDDLGSLMDAIIVFAPSGELIVEALKKVDKGGRVVAAGIYATPLPGFSYSHIWPEKHLTAVAHTTRANVREFLKQASKLKIRSEINKYPLIEANQALQNVKDSKVSGSSVLVVD